MSRTHKFGGAVLAIAILIAGAALFVTSRNLKLVGAQSFKHPPRTRHVAFQLLPNSVEVREGKNYFHEFSVPGDATNAILAGEFTVEPRIQAQLDMLLVSRAGFPRWQEYLSTPEPRDRNLLYRTGNTGADMFQIELAPGTYDLIFDYGPPSGPTFSDHGGVVGLYSSRWANTKFILSYDVPQEIR
ncbi:MAG: hypothetical protein WCD49_06490 [Candidatus Acidiferrales bacterium]